jgi:sugar fermentation stimulation protein A
MNNGRPSQARSRGQPNAQLADRGAYLLLMELKRARRIEVGALGAVRFEKGWYIYVGSAMRALNKRVARHLRRRKNKHWHVDYLREATAKAVALPIRSSRREECAIAASLATRYAAGPRGFGASDCACPTHLFTAATRPDRTRAFRELLLGWRVRGLTEA